MTVGYSVGSIFADGQSLAVDISRIDQALRQLWSERQEQTGEVARACVLNLVVYAGDEASAAVASDVVAQLTATHPCRAIVLLSDDAAEHGSLKAWLSAHCQMPKPSGKRICCEQVTLQAAGDAVERLPSAVLPLLVPDLPVALWWMGEPPFGAEIFEHLADVSDRLIVDTRQFTDPTFSLTRLAALVRANSDRIAVSDLNWARLALWQEQLTQVFDSVETLPYLEGLERLTVRYARLQTSTRIDPEQGLLLVGWLLSRLGWKFPPALARVSAGHFRGRLRRAGRELAVEIIPHDTESQVPDIDGTLLQIELRAQLREQEASFLLERQLDDGNCLMTTIILNGLEPLASTIRPHQTDLACLLAEDLSRFDHDFLFEAALETAAHLSGGAQFLPH